LELKVMENIPSSGVWEDIL